MSDPGMNGVQQEPVAGSGDMAQLGAVPASDVLAPRSGPIKRV